MSSALDSRVDPVDWEFPVWTLSRASYARPALDTTNLPLEHAPTKSVGPLIGFSLEGCRQLRDLGIQPVPGC